jgi:hypothetical protein
MQESTMFRPLLALGLAALLASCVTAPPAAPRVVSVAEWGGTPADPALVKTHTITHITLHHMGETYPPGRDPLQYLRNLQTWSRNTKHWADIPYHYIVDLDGKLFEGRDIRYAGDTNTEYDPTGHALIEVVGNFEEVEPNQAQLDAVVDAMAWLAEKYDVPVERIAAHRDYSSKTVCPGKNLYRYVENGYFRRKVAERLAAHKAAAR